MPILKRTMLGVITCILALNTLYAQFTSPCLTQYLNDYAFCESMCTVELGNSAGFNFACQNQIAGCQLGAINAFQNCSHEQ